MSVNGSSEHVLEAVRRVKTNMVRHRVRLPMILATVLAIAILLPSTAFAVAPLNVYRFYNVTNGAHFFTASAQEKASVIANYPTIYRYEGIAWTINSDSPYCSQPLHRFYNLRNGTHFYTASESEKAAVIANFPTIYRYEGVAYYVSASPVPGGLTVWRFYYKPLGSHFYTASWAEAANLINSYPTIYTYEGPAFYIPVPPAGSYNFYAAAAYADTWAQNFKELRNPAYDTSFTGVDCTNFVSQCLHDSEGGQKPFDWSGPNEFLQWWTIQSTFGWDHSLPWVNAGALYNYLIENPAGTWIGVFDGDPATYTQDVGPYIPGGRTGDVVFYDWHGDGSKDHAGICVGQGTDAINAGYTGSLTDQHSHDRYHAIWHLKPYNADFRTTRVTVVRPSN